MSNIIKFATLGTCVGAEAIYNAQEKDWIVVKNYISFSLMAIVDSFSEKIKELTDTSIYKEKKWKAEDLLDDINGKIIEKLYKAKADLYLIDLCDFRLPERIYELANGQKIYFTHKPFCDETESNLERVIESTYFSKIVKKEIVFFSNLSQEKQSFYVKKFIEIILDKFGEDKVLIYEPKLITHYIEEDKICRLSNYVSSCKVNLLIKKIYAYLDEKEYLKSPQILLGDKSFLSIFEFHYCEPYYKYFKKCIIEKIKHKKLDKTNKYLTECENYIYDLYKNIISEEAVNSLMLLSRKPKKIVTITKNNNLEKIIPIKIGIKPYINIYYDAYSDLDKIKEKIENIKREQSEAFFFVPEIFYHGERKGINKIFSDLGYSPLKDYYVYSPTVHLPNFIGFYSDIYNNYLIAESVISITLTSGTHVQVMGDGRFKNHKVHVEKNGTLIIGNSVIAHDGIIYIGHNSAVKIGSRSEISDSDIRSHNRTLILIGEDCLFSYKQMIYSSDGHAIFEVLDDNGGHKRLNDPNNDSVNIGNHVWIGYRCHIITGADIGDGSIVGAGSLVNRKFPNNCILAGVPARLIKKNRAWSKNPYHLSLLNDKNVYDNYMNLTKGDI